MARRVEDACQLSHFNSSAEPYVTLVGKYKLSVFCILEFYHSSVNLLTKSSTTYLQEQLPLIGIDVN